MCSEQLQTAQDNKHDHHHANGHGEAAVTGAGEAAGSGGDVSAVTWYVAITHTAKCYLAFFYSLYKPFLVGPFTEIHKSLTKMFFVASSCLFYIVPLCRVVKPEAGKVAVC